MNPFTLHNSILFNLMSETEAKKKAPSHWWDFLAGRVTETTGSQ